MADPIITLHDEFGDEITAGFPLALPTAIPNTPTTPDLLLSVRNNDADAGPVDTAFDTVISLTGRPAGSVAEPTADGLVYLTSRALQFQVISVEGGATSQIRSYVPVGTAASLILGEIPDGGIVNLGLRVLANLAATIQDVEIFISVASTQSTPLEIGHYESWGNYVYNGNPGGGGVPDKTFTEIISKAGALAPELVNSDTVDTWDAVEYVLEGVTFTTTPALAQLTFDDQDGAPATLAATEEYWAGIFLDGTNVFVIAKGLLGAAPLPDSARPAAPANTTAAGFVRVPFGLLIDTTVDVLVIGLFGIQGISGLDVTFAGGIAAVSNRWNVRQTQTLVSLPDDTPAVEVYVRPDIGMEAVVPPAGPTDPRAMIIHSMATAAGAVSLPTTDLRRIGVRTVIGGLDPLVSVCASMRFSSPGGAGGPHISIATPGTFVGWTNAVTIVESGGLAANPAASAGSTPSAAFTVPFDGWYDPMVVVNFHSADSSETILARGFVNDVDPGSGSEFQVPSNNQGGALLTSSSGILTLLSAGDIVDLRFTSLAGGGSIDVNLILMSFTLKLAIAT